tara:strand:+ start:25 stop:282 length:258 start_codon:yes stop_codon:yes gene_type:complete
MTAMKNFEINEKLLSLESEIARLKEVISNYEEKCKDMELNDMIEEIPYAEDKMAHDLHDYLAATHRMNKYFENKIESINKEKTNG